MLRVHTYTKECSVYRHTHSKECSAHTHTLRSVPHTHIHSLRSAPHTRIHSLRSAPRIHTHSKECSTYPHTLSLRSAPRTRTHSLRSALQTHTKDCSARTHTHTHTHSLSRDTRAQPCAAETEFHPKLFSKLPRDAVFLLRAPLWSPGIHHGGKVCLGLRQVVPSFREEDDPHLFSAPVLTPQPTECKSWVPPDPRGIHAPTIVQSEERFGQAGDGCSQARRAQPRSLTPWVCSFKIWGALSPEHT